MIINVDYLHVPSSPIEAKLTFFLPGATSQQIHCVSHVDFVGPSCIFSGDPGSKYGFIYQALPFLSTD